MRHDERSRRRAEEVVRLRRLTARSPPTARVARCKRSSWRKPWRHANVLGILPTGTGKSVCYQVPALSLYDKTGALTVVISPLVALMADQVQGMERAGISSAVTINGMLSMPERQDALDRVRLGQAAILLISPEQLAQRLGPLGAGPARGRAVGPGRGALRLEMGARFPARTTATSVASSANSRASDKPAPVLCLTATAKPEVVRDITEHFRQQARRRD